MTPEQWQDRTDDQLAEEAQTGLRGQGATVEMMRRLRDALVEHLRATNRLTAWLTVFTIVLLVVSVFQTIILLFGPESAPARGLKQVLKQLFGL
jgi:hypothetical protein